MHISAHSHSLNLQRLGSGCEKNLKKIGSVVEAFGERWKTLKLEDDLDHGRKSEVLSRVGSIS